MTKNIHPWQMDTGFKVCPSCGYTSGFHSVFERTEDGLHAIWLLICPNCQRTFDIGLRASLERTRE